MQATGCGYLAVHFSSSSSIAFVRLGLGESWIQMATMSG